MKITDDIRNKWKPSCAYHKPTLFVVNKDEWDTKEGHGKSMKMHCMHSSMVKVTSWAEVTLNSEKIKPVALAIVELCESEGIRQAVSQ